MNLGMSIADGSCFVAHESCLVDVVSSVGNVTMTMSLQLSLSSVSCVGLQQNFCFINCHPTQADHSNYCRFDMFCRLVKSFHSHKVIIPTVLVEEVCCKN